jgi:adenosylhomocysteine nucleosidase
MATDSDPGESGPTTRPNTIARKNPRRCDLAVVMSSSLESGCFEDRLSCPLTVRGDGFVVRQGALLGRPVAVAIAGPKPRQAVRAAEALAFGHSPRLLVAAGFASGLTDRAGRGDIVVGDSVLGAGRELLQLDRTVKRELLSATAGLHVGRLLMSERAIDRPAEKRSLGAEHAALAADGQSLIVAKVARSENVPFLAVRVILDAVDDEVPPEIRRLTSRKTAAQRIGAVAGSLVRRPSSIKDLWNVYDSSLAASQRLATFLESVLASMI